MREPAVQGSIHAAATPLQAAVQSVDRALSVLDILARRGEVGVTDLAAELGVHKSTAFRIVAVLEQRHLVEQVGSRGKYRLGLGILRLAAATAGQLEITVQARPVCRGLALELGETVNIAILDGGSAINVLQEFGAASVMSRNWIGRPTPLHATSSGKALLAHADPVTRTAVLTAPLQRYTAGTITDTGALSAQLDACLREGWACTVEELEAGLSAVAAPIRDGSGFVVAAVSVSGPSYRLNLESLAEIAEKVIAAAAQISGRMGFYG